MLITDKIPIISINDNLVLTRRGEYCFGFELKESEVFGNEISDIKKVHSIYSQIVNMLPSWSAMQKQDWYTERRYTMDMKRAKDFISRQYELNFHEKPYIEHKSYLFFIKGTKTGFTRKRFGTILNASIFPSESLNPEIYTKFESTVSAIADFINASSLISVRPLQREDYLGFGEHQGLIDQYLNLGDEKQITDINLKSKLKVADKKCSYFTIPDLDCYPQNVRYYDTNNNYKFPFSYLYNVGLAAKCNHIVNQIILKDDNEHVKRKIENKLMGINRWLSANTANVDNAQQIRNFLKEANSGRTIVRNHLNILTWSEDAGRLKQNELTINSALTGLGFLPKQETLDAPYLHWGSFPGNGTDIPNDLTATVFSDVACCMILNETNYTSSTSDYGMKLTPRDLPVPIHTDFTVEPKEKGIIFNYHKMGVGYSGGGKTVFCAEYLRNRLSTGGHVVAVDMGRSYGRLAQLLGPNKAVHFEYSEKKPLSFNPFFIKARAELDINKINLLIALTLGICFGVDIDSENQLVKVQVAIMKRILKEYYDQVFKRDLFPCMNTFYEYLQEYHNVALEKKSKELDYLDINALLIVLDEFYKGGIYEHVFNAKENLNLVNIPFVLFDLDSIKDDKTLLSIVTTMIITTMMEKVFKMQKDLGEKADKIIKTIFWDEAWFALMIPKMAIYAEWCVRTLRKHEGEFFAITQNLNDFIDNKFVKNILLQNIPTKIVFDISGYKENALRVCELLGFTERETQQAMSLNKNITGNGARELIIKNAHITRIYTNIISPEQLALYTTDKDDKELVDRMILQAGGNVELGIQNYLNTKKKVA